LLSLNKDFLKHNYYTDIITFELNKSDAPVLSDVFISIDRAKENAKRFNVSVYNEILRLLIHGTLHLCGFKDKEEKDYREMKELENRYLIRFVSREIN
jgi:rRNA maturation RNase YbeY